MTERQPINGKEQYKLTIEPHPNRLNDRGDIFMSTQPGGSPEIHLPPAAQEATQRLQDLAQRTQAPQGAERIAASPQELLLGWSNYLERNAQQWPADLKGFFQDYAREQIARGEMPPGQATNEEELSPEAKAQAHALLVENTREGTRAAKQNEKLQRLLLSEDVQVELAKDNPDFNSAALTDLRAYFDQIDIASDQGAELYLAAQLVAGLTTPRHASRMDSSISCSEASRRLLYEWTYEKLIGRPDFGSEDLQYNIGSFQLQNLLDEIDNVSVREFREKLPGEERSFATYLSELKNIRAIAHELNRNLNYGEQYKSYVLEHLKSNGLDFMQNDLAGVGAVVRIYEKAAAAKVAETHQWLSEGDVREVDNDVKVTLEDLHTRGTLNKDGRILTEWEIQRALRIGKIFFAGTQRMAMYTGLGNISPSISPDRIASLKYEYIVRALMPFKMVAPRFFGGNPGPRRLMELTFEEIAKRNENSPYVGLFGVDSETMMENASGAKDAESHGWRQQLMFLGNVSIDVNGKKLTLLEHLIEQARGLAPTDASGEALWDPLTGITLPDNKKGEFASNVRSDILGQRLYLSVLSRYGVFDKGLKKDIWEKIALLKPSTLASLLPETLGEGNNATWEGLRKKLYIAEEERVAHDAELYSGDVSRENMDSERANFERTIAIVKAGGIWTQEQWNSILKYMGMENLAQGAVGGENSIRLTLDEERLLQNLLKNGVSKAGVLASSQFPFTFIIDDAPKIAWKKTGDGQAGLDQADLIRILISDQKNYTDGWNELNGLFEFPTKDVIKHIATAVDKIADVDGRTSAQNQLEPIIAAWVRMGTMNEFDQWIPGVISAKHMLRKPTSEMEKYYRNEFVSMDAEERMVFLTALSQAKAIRDSLAAGDMVGVEHNMTQLDKLRKDTKSDRMSLFIYTLRTMIEIFGPAFAMEFMSGLIPKDLRG